MHYGSLLTAVASYLQARSQKGVWRVRIDNIDPPREQKNAIAEILHTLDAFGFQIDGKVLLQRDRDHYHQSIAQRLIKAGLAYRCACSRKQIEAKGSAGLLGTIYPGTCRKRKIPAKETHSVRLFTRDVTLCIDDQTYGKQRYHMPTVSGDYILIRRDGYPAYILATTLDDIAQGYTEIVRGADLLATACRQSYLNKLLGRPTPRFRHVPLVIDHLGNKLSKQDKAPKLLERHAIKQLFYTLRDLGQEPPRRLQWSSLATLWDWAIQHWDPQRIPKQPIPISDQT